jgi:hypothetical protein
MSLFSLVSLVLLKIHLLAYNLALVFTLCIPLWSVGMRLLCFFVFLFVLMAWPCCGWCSVWASGLRLRSMVLILNLQSSRFLCGPIVHISNIHFPVIWKCHVSWAPLHHGMARPQVADGGDGLRIWRVAANILNKQSRPADKGWSSSLGVGRGANDSTP